MRHWSGGGQACDRPPRVDELHAEAARARLQRDIFSLMEPDHPQPGAPQRPSIEAQQGQYRAIAGQEQEVRNEQARTLFALRRLLLDVLDALAAWPPADPRRTELLMFHVEEDGVRPYAACRRQDDPVAAIGRNIHDRLGSVGYDCGQDGKPCNWRLEHAAELESAVRSMLALLDEGL
jgi:hypothetical protein